MNSMFKALAHQHDSMHWVAWIQALFKLKNLVTTFTKIELEISKLCYFEIELYASYTDDTYQSNNISNFER